MKIRTDFVTNSSSSSFIISTEKTPPSGYDRWIKTITKETLPSFLEELADNCWHTRIADGLTDEEIQRLCNFSDEQMKIVILAINGKLDIYLKVSNALNESDTPVYYVSSDNYICEEVYNFIHDSDSEILDYERD